MKSSHSSVRRGAANRWSGQRRSRRARDRVPDPRGRSVSAQAGCGVRGARLAPRRRGASVRGARRIGEKGHSQGITSDLGALCVRPPNRYGPAARRCLICTYRNGLTRTNMAQKVRIALDAMGGDVGPAVVVPGADVSLARHPDTEFVLFGDEAVVAPLLDAAAAAEGGLAARAHRRRGEDGRQAEPGAAPRPLEVLDVARDRRGEEGRGRRRGLGRQHRRPDGDGEVQPAHHGGHRAPGDRGAVADAEGRLGRARCRRLDRRGRRASGRPRRDGQRDGARAVRPRAADRRAAQYRRRGGEGPGGGARGGPHPARGAPAVPRLCRLRRRRRHRQGRPSTWW